jgi:hypothetical protein
MVSMWLLKWPEESYITVVMTETERDRERQRQRQRVKPSCMTGSDASPATMEVHMHYCTTSPVPAGRADLLFSSISGFSGEIRAERSRAEQKDL